MILFNRRFIEINKGSLSSHLSPPRFIREFSGKVFTLSATLLWPYSKIKTPLLVTGKRFFFERIIAFWIAMIRFFVLHHRVWKA